MILGLGNDLCDIRRIEAVLDRHEQRFLARVFTEAEQALIVSRPRTQRAATCAKRFAAKEAVAKALGTGIAHGVYLTDIGVVTDSLGKPGVCLSGGAAARLASMAPPGQSARIELSMSDEYPLAQAVAIIFASLP